MGLRDPSLLRLLLRLRGREKNMPALSRGAMGGHGFDRAVGAGGAKERGTRAAAAVNIAAINIIIIVPAFAFGVRPVCGAGGLALFAFRQIRGSGRRQSLCCKADLISWVTSRNSMATWVVPQRMVRA